MENPKNLYKKFVEEYEISGYADIHEVSFNMYYLAGIIFKKRRYSKIIDVGSGKGYGTNILKILTNSHVVGIDINVLDINYAKRKYPKLTFECVDITDEKNIRDFIKRHGYFDCCSLIEVIEHIPHHKAEKALINIGKLLKPSGLLILSTPNKYI